MKQLFQILNVDCAGCAGMMEERLLNVPGIEAASIDLDTQTLLIVGKEMDAHWLQDFLSRSEPEVRVLPQSHDIEHDHEESGCGCGCGHEHGNAETDETRRVLLAAVLFFSALALHTMWQEQVHRFAVAGLFALSYLVCGIPVLRRAGALLLRVDLFNEFTLMSFASLAAIVLGDLPEAAGVMLFYSVGELFQERAAQKSRGSIKALLAEKPVTAHILRDGNVEEAYPEEVCAGDQVLVKPGERIPVDGILYSGNSRVDTSSLTGESIPVSVAPGDSLFGGSVNLEGAIVLEATGSYKDSSVARILEMVENAVARKSKTERFITRFARSYTQAVALLALLVALIPPLLQMGTLSDWGYRALVLLVISCPCALLISIPLGYFGGIGGASRKGILVKGGNVFDSLQKVDSVFFDKTGTLTHGVFEVSAIVPADGVTRETLCDAAAIAESRSNHPIARSIQKALGTPTVPEGALFTEIAGRGVSAEIEGRTLLAGNSALLEENGIAHSIISNPMASVVLVAESGRYLGHIEVSDTIRPEAAETIRQLRALGVKKIGMLTGDRLPIAEAVAQQLGVDLYRAELLPDQKVSALQELTASQEGALFVGDGVNDAPILAASRVGVAMGGLGSQAAIEVSDAVILNDQIGKVADLLIIAQKTERIIRQNIALALGTKGIFMLLGIAGEAGLWQAVFADVGVALLAVLNATRATRS